MSWIGNAWNWFDNNLGFGAVRNLQNSALSFLGINDMSYKKGDLLPSRNVSSGNSLSENALNEMNFNALEAQKNRDWQKEMRDTQLSSAFQQARDNGINPYTMFNGGAISSPVGSTASYSGYASADRSASQSGINSILALVSALAVSKIKK